ncbi:unnamed protein product [Euphydryas editha]|uniref:Uncharacterized protein n=1 Tax=Euphydryas editha TaxID=104508 RepID=A0AAU9UZJ2_EUPED|nr:unnamed protein product [Euphydryas editha]
MGDGLKITNEKRHRSSSSLAGVLEGVRSEKRLDVRASIPEVEDQYTLAETRCDSLQEKIDLVKAFKRKKKLKKRSMTTITEPASNIETVPMITIRTRPKKKLSQQTEKFSKASNVMHGYVDPDLLEQRRMISRVQGQSQMNQQQHRQSKASDQNSLNAELASGGGDDRTFEKRYYKPRNIHNTQRGDDENIYYSSRPQSKQLAEKRIRNSAKTLGFQPATKNEKERRQVVELFKKQNEKPILRINMNSNDVGLNRRKILDNSVPVKQHAVTESMEGFEKINNIKKPKVSKTVKHHNRHYELPTVSSNMKRIALYSYSSNKNEVRMPFIVSKSLAPSHNVGVNLQQILNGVKLQQPLSKIPLTIAHQMGLRHVPTSQTKSDTTQPTLSSDGMNVIKLGQKLVHLPSFKAMSYNRLLALYRAENSVVSRFLCTVGRPHYFYTSMYDLSTNQEDFDGATSKGRGSQVAKQSLAEYANLYRQYEQVEKQLNEKYDPILQKHKNILLKKLTERENYIRKLVGDSGAERDGVALGASVSAIEDDYRQSTFKLQPPT